VLQALSTISKRVIRALRDQAPGAAPAAPARPPEPPRAAPATPVERMERAMLAEAEHPEAPAVAATARGAEALLAPGWESASGEIERPAGVRLGPDLTIVSVGTAVRAGDREVALPLVLGDASGRTGTLLLTLRLDTLIEPGEDEDPA
jgi:hypothetical protein